MLDKKLCRQNANPESNLDPNNGLLYARQVEYIVCTEVKDLGADPVLMLHFFPSERTAKGDYCPILTMFQSRDDYVTLERSGGGRTKWRTAAFEKLFKNNELGRKCAFYANEDERRVGSYFHDDKSTGFSALIRAQDAYIAARRKKRQLAQERKVLARMEGLPALPGSLEDWAHRNILPAYFFYGHARHGIAVGTCSSCDSEVTLTGVRHNGKASCPNCGRELTMKPRGRVKRLYDRETFQVVQRTTSGELVIRILKASAAMRGTVP